MKMTDIERQRCINDISIALGGVDVELRMEDGGNYYSRDFCSGFSESSSSSSSSSADGAIIGFVLVASFVAFCGICIGLCLH